MGKCNSRILELDKFGIQSGSQELQDAQKNASKALRGRFVRE
jgi:hypothetical protein